MKDTITVRKKHYEFLKSEFKSFAINHKIIEEDEKTYEIEVEFNTLQQFYSAATLAGMSYGFDRGESFLKKALHPKPFSESELTQL